MWRAVALAAVGASTALTSGQTPPPTHGYYYFDEFRPLALDSARLAILDRDEPGPVAVAAAAPGALAADQVTAWPIAGWYLCDLDGPAAGAAAVEASVAAAAAGPEIDFASPVFVGDDGGPLIVTPDILVGFHPQVAAADAEAILAASGAGRVTDVNWGGMPRVYRLRSAARNGFEVLAAANALAQRPEVIFAEPDMIFTGRGALVPNDPGFPDLWGIHNTGQFGGTPGMDMDGPEAWDISTGDPSIIVLIIDVGVQQNHPDINQIPGTDTTSEGPGDGGPVGVFDNHGTAVVGCVTAIINNNLGTVGIAPGCVSASARTFITVLSNGAWTSQASWTVDSLAWAEANGVRVTNNSNSYGFQSSAIDLKYQSTRSQGMVHFGTAGNGSSSSIYYPASLDSINAIAALVRTGT